MFYVFLPALDLYSGNHNAFHYLYCSKNVSFSRGILYFLRSVSTLSLSFPFCTIPKTENSEMKTSDVLIERRGFPIPSFPFCTTLKTEDSEMKTSQFNQRPFDQTPKFSIADLSVVGIT